MKLTKTLKRKVAKIQGRVRKHQAKSQAASIQKLKLQRNKDIREATRLTKQAALKQEALEARMKRERANAPNVAARKAQRAKVAKGAKSAMKGLVKAFKGLQNYANKH